MRVVVLYTFVLLAIAVWSGCAQTGGKCSGGGGGDGGDGAPAGNPCIYDPSQGLAVGCENVDRCKKGTSSLFHCCAAVAHCASINLYAYIGNPQYFAICACGKYLIVPCPENHEFDPELNGCKQRKTGLLHVVINVATGILQ